MLCPSAITATDIGYERLEHALCSGVQEEMVFAICLSDFAIVTSTPRNGHCPS